MWGISIAMSSAASRISSSLQETKTNSTYSTFHRAALNSFEEVISTLKADDAPSKCLPFVVLLCEQRPCLYKLLQQQAHVLPCNGAAFKCRFHTVPHKHIEQWSTIELSHTLQRLLQSQR